MKWNWQQPDWPDFRWNGAALAALEARFLQQSGVMIGVVKHLGEEDRTSVVLDVMTDEAIKTSQIALDACDRHGKARAGDVGQFLLEVAHRAALNFAGEAQRDMQVLGRHPARVGHARLQRYQRVGDLLRDGQGDEQTRHNRRGSS